MPYDTPRGELLDEASALIHGDRNKTYGSPVENFENTAALWTVQLRNKLKPGEKIEAAEVALLMIHLKLARTINQPKRDNFLDIAGYAACGWEAANAVKVPRKLSEPAVTVSGTSESVDAYLRRVEERKITSASTDEVSRWDDNGGAQPRLQEDGVPLCDCDYCLEDDARSNPVVDTDPDGC